MQSLATCQTCDLSIKQSSSKATVGIHWCYGYMNGTEIFQVLSFLQPQLSVISSALPFASVLLEPMAKRLMKLPGTKLWSQEKLI